MDTISFQNEILPIIVSNCASTSCHNSASRLKGLDLSNYKNIRDEVKYLDPYRSTLYSIIALDGNGGTMPPKYRLIKSDQEKIKQWILQGSQNTTNLPKSICDSTDLTYQKISILINQFCVGCHNQTGPNFDLSTYTTLKSAVYYRSLLNSINHSGSVSAMPPSYKLNQCELNKIEKWITLGMPEN